MNIQEQFVHLYPAFLWPIFVICSTESAKLWCVYKLQLIYIEPDRDKQSHNKLDLCNY